MFPIITNEKQKAFEEIALKIEQEAMKVNVKYLVYVAIMVELVDK